MRVVERKIEYAVISKLTKKTFELISSLMAKTLKPITTKAKTLTYDKEIEFAELSLIGEVLYIATYFAMPFASWMWKNEKLTGLLRQYKPKTGAMSAVRFYEIRMIQNRLINKPRKRLKIKTFREGLQQSFKCVVLRT